jgi:hypothetical protein
MATAMQISLGRDRLLVADCGTPTMLRMFFIRTPAFPIQVETRGSRTYHE